MFSRDEGEEAACFLGHRRSVRTVQEIEGKKELPFKIEVERKFVNVQETKERQSLFSETEVESKNKRARDRGEERAFFQDRGREQICNLQEMKGKTELVF